MIVSYTDSSKPGPKVVWILNATSTICFAISFSVMGGHIYLTQRRKGAKNKPLESQWLQRPGLGAFEEPARAHTQTMVPGRQPRGIHREASLPGERTADHLAGREHCR